jgi:hypothetical protein
MALGGAGFGEDERMIFTAGLQGWKISDLKIFRAQNKNWGREDLEWDVEVERGATRRDR